MGVKFDFLLGRTRTSDEQDLSSIVADVSTLKDNEFRFVYWEEVNSGTGTITKPTGSTILLDQFPSAVDGVVETLVSGKPSGISATDSGGNVIFVTSLDTSGNYVLSGTPTTDIAFIYLIKIKAIDLQNLDGDFILDWEKIGGEFVDEEFFLRKSTNPSDKVSFIVGATGIKYKTFQDNTGTIYETGGVDVSITDGGTGASSASQARINLGLEIGVDIEAYITPGLSSQYIKGDKTFGTFITDVRTSISGGSGISYNNVSGVITADYTTLDGRYVLRAGDSGLGNLLFATGNGIDSAVGGTLVVGDQNATVINIGTGNTAKIINVGSQSTLLDQINLYGAIFRQDVTNLSVSDKLVTYNVGGAAASGGGSGFEIEENGVITGYFKTNVLRSGFEFKAPSLVEKFTLSLAALTSDQSLQVPNGSGTIIYDGGSYADPAWITSLAFSKISGVPTYLKADGTVPLSASWAAGNFTITANGVLVGSASNTLSLNSSSGGAGTIQSTSHATKGILNIDGKFYFDGVNARLGINSSSPASALEIFAEGSSTSQEGIRWRLTGLAHGMTSLVPTDVNGFTSWLDATTGGFLIRGLTGADGYAVDIGGTTAATSPTTATVRIRGSKKSGTNHVALAATEKLVEFSNSTSSPIGTLMADGKLGLGSGDTPLSVLELVGLGVTATVDGIRLRQPNVAHGMTTNLPTDVYGAITYASSTAGGLGLTGYSDTDSVGFQVIGVVGNTSPTAPAMQLRAFKKSGTTVASMAAGEKMLSIVNNSTQVFTFTADGFAGFNMTGIPASVIEINGGGSTATADGIRWRQPNVAHGMTTLIPTDVYGYVTWVNTNNGGLLFRGYSDTDSVALDIGGINGATSPTVAPNRLRGFKKSGTTAGSLADTERMVDYYNNTTLIGTMLGNGYTRFASTGVPSSVVHITGLGSSNLVDGIQLGQPSVTHGITTVADTDSYGLITWINSTTGGLNLTGISDTDAAALFVRGISGSTTPTIAAIRMRGDKKSGTGTQALAATEKLWDATNAGTVVWTMMADGKTYFGGTASPTTWIELAAGTTTLAPFKFTSGTNLTTAVPGTMEYNGTNLFFTRTGTTRESVICANVVNSVSPTAPNRTITVNIDGSTYYIHAKTTND